MKPLTTILFHLILCAAVFTPAFAQTSKSSSTKPEAQVLHAKGSFEVKVSPQASADLPQDVIGRMSIDKTFHGDLDGTSKGEMLAAGSGAKGSSGGYVALEQVSGTLGGRKGTFVLQHCATMTNGVPQISIAVVPGSGTDQLAGLSGQLNIIIEQGKHSYDFEYSLPESH